MNKSIATKIRTLRTWNELTQAQLSKMIGVSTTSISGWESGKSNISQDNTRRLEEALNARIDSVCLTYDSAGE